jgi:hypothetical protein
VVNSLSMDCRLYICKGLLFLWLSNQVEFDECVHYHLFYFLVSHGLLVESLLVAGLGKLRVIGCLGDGLVILWCDHAFASL